LGARFGPIITIILGKVGHAAVKVFYRRFIEAWINLRNVEEMLGDDYTELINLAKKAPLFKSKLGRFIARFERREIENIIEEARRDGSASHREGRYIVVCQKDPAGV
jgi:hypothetical protein